MKVYVLTRGQELKILGAATHAGGELFLNQDEINDLKRRGWEIRPERASTYNSKSDLSSIVREIVTLERH